MEDQDSKINQMIEDIKAAKVTRLEYQDLVYFEHFIF